MCVGPRSSLILVVEIMLLTRFGIPVMADKEARDAKNKAYYCRERGVDEETYDRLNGNLDGYMKAFAAGNPGDSPGAAGMNERDAKS